MALIAGLHYDPSTAATKATTALLAMTAFDTTNIRLTFTAPTNGNVLVRVRCAVEGNATAPNILLGVLESSTVVGRQAAITSAVSSATSARQVLEAAFVVTGLTAGSHTWDAAYAVQLVQTTSQIEYGGPNDTTTDNAWGGLSFEVWETANLIASTNYDPSTAGSIAVTALAAMAVFDSTNLRLTFTAPKSGNVMIRIRCVVAQSTTPAPSALFGVLESSTVVARSSPMGGRTNLSAIASGCYVVHEAEMLILGISAGSHTYDAAFGIEIAAGASTTIKWGGPNDTTGADAWGGFVYEVWAV